MKSMTGYGNSSFYDETYEVEVEIKSLNHRFLDINININNEISHLENQIKQQISDKIKRGKVYATVYATVKRAPDLQLNKEMLLQVREIYQEAYQTLEIDKQVDPEVLLKYEGVILHRKEKYEDERLTEIIKETVEECLLSHDKMSRIEGNKTKDWLQKSLQHIEKELVPIQDYIPQYREELKQRLQEVVKEFLSSSIDSDIEKKLMAEVAFYMDKYDINEEIVRLKDHIEKFDEVLKEDAQLTGKKMNFIVQEMQREIQTISSKFKNIKVFPSILAIKEEVEKCREMVQNVE